MKVFLPASNVTIQLLRIVLSASTKISGVVCTFLLFQRISIELSTDYASEKRASILWVLKRKEMDNSSNQITYRISSDSSSPVLPRGFGNGEGVAAVLVVCPGSASAASVAVMIHFANWLLPNGGDPLLRRITPESSSRPAWPPPAPQQQSPRRRK